MSLLSYLIPVAIYVGVVVYMAWCYGQSRTLQFRDILGIVIWPLDLVWPFLLAAVAVLELAFVLAAKRLSDVTSGQHGVDPV